MEADSDFRQECLQILAAQILLCGVSYFLEHVTASFTRLRVHSGEGQIVVSRLEIILLLFG